MRGRTGSSSIAVNRMVERVDRSLFLHANCSVQMISPRSYRTMQLPVEQRMAARHPAFRRPPLRGNMHQVAPAYAELGIAFADVGWGSDVAACRASPARHVPEPAPEPHPHAAVHAGEVAADAESLLRAAGPLDQVGLCCINMDYGTPDDNIFAVYEVVERYRRDRVHRL